ncbi:MAG TPA: DUF488 domain-containing protein, partial [Vicinamibacterales bacterium]|nr:DUF488 domain-containing protein [Vicinamibacterales bacterium]
MIYTVGHSTHTIDAFMELLRQHGVRQIADVRRVPASARHPQFGRHRLRRSLLESGVDYRHFAALGGLRAPQTDSVNAGLRNASHRGYADHMLTPEFDEALIQLIDYARRAPTAAMCAELRYSDCHRQLL